MKHHPHRFQYNIILWYYLKKFLCFSFLNIRRKSINNNEIFNRMDTYLFYCIPQLKQDIFYENETNPDRLFDNRNNFRT